MVSPDQTRLAFLEYLDHNDPPENQLRILTSDGQKQPVTDWPEGWIGDMIGWSDQERLVLTDFWTWEGKVNIYHVSTGEWQVIEPTFPMTNSNGKLTNAGWGSPGCRYVFYDTTFSQVVYMRFLDKRYTYELWDVHQERILWEASTGRPSSRPTWSPHGDAFAVLYSDYSEGEDRDPTIDYGALYIVNREGQATQLADRVAGYQTWSPDGRYIATWWRGGTDFAQIPNWRDDALAIVDTMTGDISIYPVGFSGSLQYPIWSPEGDMVALVSHRQRDETEDPDTSLGIQVLIVDIVNNRGFTILRDANVLGWMKP